MPILSAGYPKINANDGKITADQWARSDIMAGAAYDVLGVSDFRVSATSTVLTVQVAPGTIRGRGITDTLDVATNVKALDAVTGTAGVTKRYDTIVLRRNWSTPGSTLEVIKGTGTAVIGTRNKNPGVLDDQPLALVEVTAGSTVPVVVADLRLAASKLTVASDMRALVDLEPYGETVVNGTRYRNVPDASGNLSPQVISAPVPFAFRGAALPAFPGLSAANPGVEAVRTQRGFVHLITTFERGNEVTDPAPTLIPFPVKFPTAVMGVEFSQIMGGPLTAPRPMFLTDVTTSGFRAVWPGGTGIAERAFTWTATGY